MLIKRKTIQTFGSLALQQQDSEIAQSPLSVVDGKGESSLVGSLSPSLLEEKVGRLPSGIGRGVSITGGTLRFERSVKIEGNFSSPTGSLNCGRVVLISNVSKISTPIVAETALVQGKVVGKVKASKKIELFSGSEIEGGVEAPIVVMHEGARVNGRISTANLMSA